MSFLPLQPVRLISHSAPAQTALQSCCTEALPAHGRLSRSASPFTASWLSQRQPNHFDLSVALDRSFSRFAINPPPVTAAPPAPRVTGCLSLPQQCGGEGKPASGFITVPIGYKQPSTLILTSGQLNGTMCMSREATSPRAKDAKQTQKGWVWPGDLLTVRQLCKPLRHFAANDLIAEYLFS